LEHLVDFYCTTHQRILHVNNNGKIYHCPQGCSFPIINSIARFVTLENYASSFGLQWNIFRRTQLDSYTGLPISRNRLTRILGGSLEIVKDKLVLEAGCGAGRFTEILLQAGAKVFATDLSQAVEANHKNCGHFPKYQICQADLLSLPVNQALFDVVICIGVIQHTPEPEQTIRTLCSYVKPGGLLAIDHYAPGYRITPVRQKLRKRLLLMSSDESYRFCKRLTSILWPLHRLIWKCRNVPGIRRIRSLFLSLSPLVDYHDAYGQLGKKLLREWALLDTHDTLTDMYKHLRTPEEIENHIKSCGMCNVTVHLGGNGVEALARKPFNV
jgi:SAM-dependent methyltransferase